MVTSINMQQNDKMICISLDFKDIMTQSDIDEMSKTIKLINDAAIVAVKEINKVVPTTPEEGRKGRTLANRLIG